MIIQGDSLTVLKTLPSESVNTCVTSPPYYALRDYGIDGQIGLEDTPEAYIARLVDVFHEVKRVLRDDGTLWVNIADSYWGSGSRGYDFTGKWTEASAVQSGSKGTENLSGVPKLTGNNGAYKNKDLIGIPWMLAFALRADGWYLRQDIIWAKKNCMPESVTDRCTKSHEYIFLLSKRPRYYFDHEAIKTPSQDVSIQRKAYGLHVERPPMNGQSVEVDTMERFVPAMANKRDVWFVAAASYSGAHFATYPEKLIEPCILSSTKVGGVVLDCFNGAGTTGVVCAKLDREYIGIELNPEYVKLSEGRIAEVMETVNAQKAQTTIEGW